MCSTFKTYPKSNHALLSLQLTALAQDTIFSSLDSYSGLLTYVPEYMLLNFFFTQEPGWFSEILSQIIPLPRSKLSKDFPSHSESIWSPNHGLESSSDQGPTSSLIPLHLSVPRRLQSGSASSLCSLNMASMPHLRAFVPTALRLQHCLRSLLECHHLREALCNTLSNEAPSATHCSLILLHGHSWYLMFPKLQYASVWLLLNCFSPTRT